MRGPWLVMREGRACLQEYRAAYEELAQTEGVQVGRLADPSLSSPAQIRQGLARQRVARKALPAARGRGRGVERRAAGRGARRGRVAELRAGAEAWGNDREAAEVSDEWR